MQTASILQHNAPFARLSSSHSSALRGRTAAAAAPVFHTSKAARRLAIVRAAADDDDDEFEARLAALKKAKGETPYGEGRKAEKKPEKKPAPTSAKKEYDYTGESVVFESPPHRGDLAVNVALGATLLWLPLSIAAIGRGLFVKYRFTDRRISVVTSAPWQNEQLDAAYEEVTNVISIGRGVGAWGDMVVTLRDGSKIEMRSLPRFKEMEAYILQRRDELTGRKKGGSGGSGGSGSAADAAPAAASPKGFA